jgi:hypothetical protein
MPFLFRRYFITITFQLCFRKYAINMPRKQRRVETDSDTLASVYSDYVNLLGENENTGKTMSHSITKML